MRTKRLAVLATSLVATLLGGACQDITNVKVYNFNRLGNRVDTVGTCVVTTSLGTTIANFIPGATLSFPQGDVDSLMVGQVMNPIGCRPPNTWTFVSNNPGVVSVSQYSTNGARITAVSPGSATIIMTAVENPSIVLLLNLVVPGGTGTTSFISYSPTSGTVALGDTLLLTATCVRGTDITENCVPHWESSNPAVFGIIMPSAGPSGMTAKLVRRAPGNARITVRWSRVRLTPFFFRDW